MPIPAGTVVTDLVIKTVHAERKSRFYWTSDVAPAEVRDMEAIANEVKTTFAAQVAALMPTTHSVLRVDARYYSGVLDLEAPSNTAAVPGTIPTGGTVAVDAMPDEAALILRVQTGKLGRSKRGRRFISGLSEDINAGGAVATGARARCVALATKVAQDIEVTSDDAQFVTFLHARHYDRKFAKLEVITKCWALSAIGTRKDRRKPLALVPITITA
jgi:hypothetical protein